MVRHVKRLESDDGTVSPEKENFYNREARFLSQVRIYEEK